jgi:hypothetical protein
MNEMGVYSDNNSVNRDSLLDGKTVSMPFCLSQIPLRLAWDPTPGLRGERLWTDTAPVGITTIHNMINIGLGLWWMKIA